MKRPSDLCIIAGSLLVPVFTAQAADVKSVSRIAFGPENTLFMADWKAAVIHAVAIAPGAKGDGKPFNLTNFDAVVAKALGKPATTIEDMAARPGTSEVYVAVSLGAARQPAILVVKADGSAKVLDLKNAKSTSAKLDKPVDDKLKFWNTIPGRSFTVTDMKWQSGELFVAGLSNQDFASTLRRIKYPFSGPGTMSSIEIFHTAHNQIETRAPIRAMTFADLGGKPHLIATYTCTPLVTIPLDDLKDGAHLRGKTIAELGYGNTPSVMLSYTATDQQGKSAPYILITNMNRDADVLPLAAIEEANKRPGMTKAVENWAAATGVTPTMAPLAGVLRIDNQNDQFFIAVRRNLVTGLSELVSIDKGVKLRLSDFVSEYNFPGYSYEANGEMQVKFVKPLQNKLKVDEGYPSQVVK